MNFYSTSVTSSSVLISAILLLLFMVKTPDPRALLFPSVITNLLSSLYVERADSLHRCRNACFNCQSRVAQLQSAHGRLLQSCRWPSAFLCENPALCHVTACSIDQARWSSCSPEIQNENSC
jgi:hypothetical protein